MNNMEIARSNAELVAKTVEDNNLTALEYGYLNVGLNLNMAAAQLREAVVDLRDRGLGWPAIESRAACLDALAHDVALLGDAETQKHGDDQRRH